jgi:hypothetical protein
LCERRVSGVSLSRTIEEARKMSELLEMAQLQIAAGNYRAATETLWRVEVLARYDVEEARGLLRLAIAVRDKGGRRVHKDCDWLVTKAQQIIESFESAQVH